MAEAKNKSCITFLPENKQVKFSEGLGLSVLEVALRGHIPLGHSCGGNGYCTTCRVFIESDLSQLAPRNEIEAEAAVERGFLPEERLACQVEAVDGLTVRLPE